MSSLCPSPLSTWATPPWEHRSSPSSLPSPVVWFFPQRFIREKICCAFVRFRELLTRSCPSNGMPNSACVFEICLWCLLYAGSSLGWAAPIHGHTSLVEHSRVAEGTVKSPARLPCAHGPGFWSQDMYTPGFTRAVHFLPERRDYEGARRRRCARGPSPSSSTLSSPRGESGSPGGRACPGVPLRPRTHGFLQ